MFHIHILDRIIIPEGKIETSAPGGWIRLFWTADPGAGIPSKSYIGLLDKNVSTSRFSTRNPIICNNHIYDVHASELLNFIFG